MRKKLMSLNVKLKNISLAILNSESFIGEIFFKKSKLKNNNLIYFVMG